MVTPPAPCAGRHSTATGCTGEARVSLHRITFTDDDLALLAEEAFGWDEVTEEDLVAFFTMGHCHSLALAIHGIRHWPLVLVGDCLRDEYGEVTTFCGHAGVVAPTGDVLDIEGLWDPDAWYKAWDEGWGAEDMWEAQVSDFDHWCLPASDEALLVAKLLLEQVDSLLSVV